MALVDNTIFEFLKSYKLNFKDWKIVDVDHFMKGNSFFSKFIT